MKPQEIEAMKTERDALLAQVDALSAALKSLLKTPLGIGGSLQADGQFYYKVPESVFKKAGSTLGKTPQQCLRDVQAEAGRAGFIAGFNWSDCIVNGESVPSASSAISAAEEYAAKVRQGKVM